MKVYLVHCEYYDYDERVAGSMLLGIYSSMDKALEAQKRFFDEEVAECVEMHCNYLVSEDHNEDPCVTKIVNGDAVEDNTFTIEEWFVN